ncbi:hypothetical protein MRX96_039449 [Rhipicephalus microplus]
MQAGAFRAQEEPISHADRRSADCAHAVGCAQATGKSVAVTHGSGWLRPWGDPPLRHLSFEVSVPTSKTERGSVVAGNQPASGGQGTQPR